MSKMPKVTKEQLLKMIDELNKNPNDKIRILGDIGITIVGAGLGATAAGTLAGVAGAATTITLFGWTVASTTPIGWVIVCTVIAAAIFYRFSRMIRGGGLSEGRKKELLRKYQEDINDIEYKERYANIAPTDRTQFILSLRELIDKNVISPDKSFKLISHVEQGHMSLSLASKLIQNLL